MFSTINSLIFVLLLCSNENLTRKMSEKIVEHPGIVLERMIKEKGISKRELALTIGEYPQLLGDVTNGKRRMNASLSVRIGRALGVDEEYFMMLQMRYDIACEREKGKNRVERLR